MRKIINGIQHGQPAKYQIQVQGRLRKEWSDWFDNLVIANEKNTDGATITILTGIVQDQAALHGVLNRIRDLNIPLLSVEHIYDIKEE